MAGCKAKPTYPNSTLTLADFDSLRTSDFTLDPHAIRREIRKTAGADSDSMVADYRVRRYYSGQGELLWIDRHGVGSNADSLVNHLRCLEAIGFSPRKFRLPQIEEDLQRVRNLGFGEGKNSVNRVCARLEYNLSKAYLRYAMGQQFGFVTPGRLLNRMDTRETSSGGKAFQTLFDLPVPHPNKRFFADARRMVRNDSVGQFLTSIEPKTPLYDRLLHAVKVHMDAKEAEGMPPVSLKTLLVNLDRCRWRLEEQPWKHGKYVLVNIPAYRLYAVDGRGCLSMRIGCGSLKSKTPLLQSCIKRMDINPQWIMPASIVRKSIVPRLGNHWYFRTHHYFFRERATGKKVDMATVSAQSLRSGEVLCVQEGGEGNALGRIIFRFDNNFSIYLHDTSSRDFFASDDRSVSHGCVRVEHPFTLAKFLLGTENDQTLDKVRYSMRADVSPLGKRREDLTDGERQVADTLKRDRLIGSVAINPQVPLYILYFTIFPQITDSQSFANLTGEEGRGGPVRLLTFPDVYGYDAVHWHYLKNYV